MLTGALVFSEFLDWTHHRHIRPLRLKKNLFCTFASLTEVKSSYPANFAFRSLCASGRVLALQMVSVRPRIEWSRRENTK